MASKTIVVSVCDLCGAEEAARTHTVRVDRRTAELEACPNCWDPIKDVIEKAIAAGRRVEVPTRAASKKTVKAAPLKTAAAKTAPAKKTATTAPVKSPAAKTATAKKTAKKKTSKAAQAKVLAPA